MKRSKTTMPQPHAFAQPRGLTWELAPQALERWSPEIMAASAAADNTISVLDPIGVDPWTGDGVTAKRIAAALRTIGAEKDVVVNVNSPGGDLFEGFAIYNLLREHRGQVTVKVLGLAASAASIVAMAGDEIQIARAGFMMIHNTWILAIGDRNDLRDAANMLEPFDQAMAAVYAARSGESESAIAKMMDRETWLSGTAAVDQGFADELLPADEVKKSASAADRTPLQRVDLVLAKAGMPRSERRALLQAFSKSGTPSAAGTGTPSATEGTPRAAEEKSSYLDFVNKMELPL